jgi:biotin carboxyl carrier protein
MTSTTSTPVSDQSSASPQLWTSFIGSRSEEEYFDGWLALQSRLVKGTVQSLLVIADGHEFKPAAGWPEGASDPARLADLLERVFDEQCGLLMELEEGAYGVAYPVFVDENLYGVIAFELVAAGEEDLQQAMEQLQWGAAWLELLVRRSQNEENQTLLHRLKGAVDMLAITLGEKHFSASAMAFTTELAAAADCERVSLGFRRGRHFKLEAVSHSAEVGGKMNLTRTIERVMEEAVQQKTEVMYPAPEDKMLICREHEALSRQQSMAAVITFPLYGNDSYYGALTCERGAGSSFSERDVEFIRAVAELTGPALQNKLEIDLPLTRKAWRGTKTLLQNILGPAYLGRKLLLLILCALVFIFSSATGEYRLTADTILEGAVQRAVVVPFDGYINKATAKAGDLVEQGQLLCALDDRDLHLEKLSMHSKYNQMERQYQEAVAKHDRAQSGIVKAQLEQYQAELDLLQSKLDRTRIVAPISGLLVSGDLSQRLGSAVEQGEILFEVTPLDSYRLILKVDERRIGDIKAGQKGELVLPSLPHRKYSFTVNKITPISVAAEGRNYFRVEAELMDIESDLRPGMNGIGKISIDQRKLFSIWTRDLAEWLKIKLWSWLP